VPARLLQLDCLTFVPHASDMTVAATTDTTLAVLSFCSDMATGRCRYRWGPLPGCHRVAAAMKEPGDEGNQARGSAQDRPDLFNPVYRASEFPKISPTR